VSVQYQNYNNINSCVKKFISYVADQPDLEKWSGQNLTNLTGGAAHEYAT